MEIRDELRLITMNVGREIYGIDIFCVDSIIKPVKITPVPLVDDCFLGVINMRGTVIPVISMRRKLEFEDCEIGEEARILVLRTEDGELVGALADSVHDVLLVEPEKYSEELPESIRNRAFISGVIREDEQLITVLNVNAVLNTLERAESGI